MALPAFWLSPHDSLCVSMEDLDSECMVEWPVDVPSFVPCMVESDVLCMVESDSPSVLELKLPYDELVEPKPDTLLPWL